MSVVWAQCLVALALGALTLGCGARAHDEIPPELLAALESGQSGRGDAEYPEGKTGNRVGDVAPNICVLGWPSPKAAGYDEERMETLCFSDYWDPEGARHHLLLVNTAAIWCTTCQAEYQGSGLQLPLAEQVEQRRERGLRMLGTLFQDASRNPAQVADGRRWAQTFAVDFPFGIDPEFEMGAFANPVTQPFNMLIDARTMQILVQVHGDNPEQLWSAIDAHLDAAR